MDVIECVINPLSADRVYSKTQHFYLSFTQENMEEKQSSKLARLTHVWIQFVHI